MKKLLASLLSLVMLFLLVGCNNNKNANNITENAEQNEVTEKENEKQDEPSNDDTIVVENFVGQKLIENDGDIEVNFTISKIEMQDRGLCVFYEISRNSSGYAALYTMEDIRLNGCKIFDVVYYSGYNTEKEMGKNTSKYPDVPLIWVIPSETLNNLGITEFDSLEFELLVGWSGNYSAELEYYKDIVLFKGTKHEIERYQLPYDEKHITLVDNEKCKIVMVDAEWIGKSKDTVYGQEYGLFFDVKSDTRIMVTLDSISFGDNEVNPEGYDDFIYLRRDNNFYVDGGENGLQTVNWTHRENKISDWDYTNAVFNFRVSYEDEAGNTEEESISVPMNLNLPFEE